MKFNYDAMKFVPAIREAKCMCCGNEFEHTNSAKISKCHECRRYCQRGLSTPCFRLNNLVAAEI
jgi:predicted Zn-ribbon and HTH transcriptional regulator